MLVCNKCSRANPAQAVYCYYDGVALSRPAGGGGGVAAPPAPVNLQQFSQPFTFPGGAACRNFDQLALGCQENWAAALELLKQGHLEKFLGAQGRADLAMAAREAARFPDKDRGLDQFLARLPSQAVKAPQLRVDQTVITLGTIKVGEDRKVELNLENQGMRLLYGSVTVQDAPWLTVGAKPGAQQKLFQFGSELTIPINVIGKRIRASNKPLEGQLIIESNGGNFVVNVKADVGIKPYPNGVLAGARSPRQVAEKAKANPKESAMLFEKGSVAAWYKENGWIYPVRGPAASGLGAVQQYFEALGLTPPPKVSVGDKQVNLQAEPGATVQHAFEVRSDEKRPVYAHATSDQPWLEVGRARLNGRIAAIPLRVSNVPARSGETLHAKLTVTSNGNQRFVIPVTLRIGQAESIFAPVAPVGKAGPIIAGARRSKPFNKAHLLPAILLACACLLVIAWDLLRDDQAPVVAGDVVGKTGDTKVSGEAPKGPTPKSNELYVSASFTRDTSRFGVVCNMLKDPINPQERKKLTRDVNGYSNNTCFRVDGYEYLFGHEIPANRWVRDKGKLMREAPIPGVAADRGWRSIMHSSEHRVTITQDVQVVVSENTLLYDTALVTYIVKNEDKSRHTVGLRVMLDTYIGSNDGVPIYVPDHGDPPKPPFLLTTMQEFPQKDIPDYIMAVENGDLRDQNSTIAVMGLRLKGIEVPEKMVICRWPQNSEAKWGGTGRLGDWKYEPMDANPKVKDSCVLLYWREQPMNPGEQRRLGFTYGLGRIAGISTGDETIAEKGGGQMRLFTSISRLKKPFTATAYIKTNQQGEKVTMALPSGMAFAPGQAASQVVPPASSAGYSAVSWRVVAEERGEYELKATVDSIGTASAKVRVSGAGLFD